MKGKRQRKIFYLILTSCFLLLAALSFSCSSKNQQIYRKSMVIMDTLVTITVASDSGDAAEKAMDRAFEKIKRLDGLINFFSDKSELSSINNNAGVAPVKVSPETLDLIEKAVYASEKTEGAFDATIGPVITQWNFSGAATQKVPDDELIKEKRRLVNYRRIAIDKERATADHRV